MKDCKVGDIIRWRGKKGSIRARIEALDGDNATVRLLRRGAPTDMLKDVQLSSLPDLDYSMEMAEELFSITAEMGGEVPTIPLPANIKLDRLKKVLGEELMFVTLPIGKVGITSRNGNTYGRKAIERLVEQVNAKRPEGRWGHLSNEELGTRYEPPAVRWLAAQLDSSGVAWGKLVPLTQEALRHFETAEATGGRVGTSIFGLEPKSEAGEITDYRLVTIDLANAERVGVPLTAAHPYITSEMEQPERGSTGTVGPTQTADAPHSQVSTAAKEENPVATETRVEELASDRARLQEQVSGLEKQIKELRAQADDLAVVRELLDVDEDVDIIKTLRAHLEQHAELASENAALLDSAMTAEIAAKVKVESARPIVRELVEAKTPLTRKALDRALDEVLARDSVKTLIAQQVAEQSGPPQSRPVTPAASADAWKQYVNIPQEA
jgi:hypothetical protein